ncbi:MAG TPA: DUF5916 domain-containing protein [Gemmatimonadales bacterium]|nr:DUF5916 domain-containing protein [Gemmatimonadales bacterium]
MSGRRAEGIPGIRGAALWLACAGLLPTLAAAQGASTQGSAVRLPTPVVSERSVVATRAVTPPVIDGRDDDAVWRVAPPITAFRVYRPVEDGDPKFKTEAKVAYDANYLYVFVRAYDPHPDSIVGLLARRDAMTPSDLITVFLDGYHDRRSGYEFDVNPAGVKTDLAIYQDGNEDMAWDGIWDVATRVDSLGWTAEFRFPFSQIKHGREASKTFGFTIARTVERTTEQSSWPVYHVSRPGLASQLGDLTGLDSLAPPRRAEIAPYGVAKNVTVPRGTEYGRDQQFSAGVDFKVGVASNLTVTGTVNPDFGQVEADPAVLNLSAFETFFPEKRPFFVEGNGLFQFSVDCSQVNCSNEQLFYSRRIGREPQLDGLYGDANSPTRTSIIGAAKLTGQLAGGLSIGAIDAVTQRETGVGGATIEPTTNYAVLRATQDFKAGQDGIGFMFTGVNRDLDSWTSPSLGRNAYVGAFEFRHQFLNRRYQLTGSFDLSRVSGTPAAITALQTDDVHLYQRPDGALHVDSTATSLSGDAEEVHFGKIGGERLQFETSYLRRSPGFEINDLGFLRQADQQSWNTWFGFSYNHPTAIYQRMWWNLNWWQYWSAAGLPTERAFNANIHSQLSNRWWIHTGATLGQLGTTWCDRCARGGPAVRQDPYFSPWLSIQGDDRHRLIPGLNLNGFRGDAGKNSQYDVNPTLTLNASTRFSATVGVDYNVNTADNQYFGTFTDSGTHASRYAFAHLDQKTLSFTANLAYTVTPTLSLQWYLQPFVSRGTYSNVRDLTNPGAADYDARYQPDTLVTNPGGVDSKQFNSNFVVRWEYKPGSTLFLVWTQQRGDFQSIVGPNGLSGAFNDLWDLHPDNTFLVKVSYWFSR